MAKFIVSIEECVVKGFEYEADSSDEAFEKAYDDYRHQRIVVDEASGARAYWVNISTISEDGVLEEHYDNGI